MVKFIIEVSEDYIRESADAKKMLGNASQEGGQNAIAKLVNMFGYTEVVKKMDEGKTEFVITREQPVVFPMDILQKGNLSQSIHLP